MTVAASAMGGNSAKELHHVVERIERLETDKKAIADDLKEVYATAKKSGFDTKALRQLIRERKQDPDERAETEMIIEAYKAALRDFVHLPLGEAAIRAVGG